MSTKATKCEICGSGNDHRAVSKYSANCDHRGSFPSFAALLFG